MSIEYTSSAHFRSLVGFFLAPGGGGQKATANFRKKKNRNACEKTSTRTFMDMFAAILTALDIADIKIFVVNVTM